MRLTRIYLPQPLQTGVTAFLDAQASHHLQHVLRLKIDDPLLVFDGTGNEHRAKIVSAQKSVQILIQEAIPVIPESPLHIYLAQAISRGDKMDYTLQKAVELGVHVITPLFTERCGVKLSDERLQHKWTHWQKIMVSACEQSGRSHMPFLSTPLLLSAWLKQSLTGYKLMLHPHAARLVIGISPSPQSVCLLVGSEGGFSDAEVRLANEAKFTAISLGPRILRTETAALAAITVVQSLWGDMH